MSEPTEAQRAEAKRVIGEAAAELNGALLGSCPHGRKKRACCSLCRVLRIEDRMQDLVLPLIQERDEARAKYQFMIERTADEKLDGYRELGRRAADAENALVAARADADRLAEVLAIAHSSIASLEDEALGVGNSTGGSTHWYIRDEVLGRLEAALAAHAEARK